MTLTPIDTPVVKSADPLFNHKAAAEAVELVMKMDEDSARSFTYMVVRDVLEEEINANQRLIQSKVNSIVAKRIDAMKKATLSAISKGETEEAKAFAAALVTIEKAVQNPYSSGAYRFDETDFRRDPRSGRFMTKVHVNTSRGPLHHKDAETYGVPDKKGLNDEQRSQYQQEYVQLANFLNAIGTSVQEPGNANIFLHLRNKQTGQQYTTAMQGTSPTEANNKWDPKTERLVGVEAQPHGGISIGGASFNVLNSLGASSHTGAKASHTMNRVDSQLPGFSNDWTDVPNDDSARLNPNQRTYHRIAAGSKFLGDIAPFGSKLQVAAKFGEFVGSRGPEAERVFGPYTRRMAYRYRGTETKPDETLMSQYAVDVARENRVTQEITPEERADRRKAEVRAESAAKARKAVATNTDIDRVKLTNEERISAVNDARKKWAAGRAATAGAPKSWDAGRLRLVKYLERRLPQKKLHGLQLDSGHTPPSEGFLIDRKGQVRAQAVGYGDDHYLPFNLKHMQALQGGEYIRTRSLGGPTTEDIYTGLVMGARRVTVVSRSGTFTVEFEDDFRGGRRHNDKARRMVGRYEKLLDSIQSETIQNQDVLPEIKDAFKRSVNEKYPWASPRERAEHLTQMVNDFKANPEMNQEQMAAFEQEYEKQAARLNTDNERAELRQKMANSWAAQQEFTFKLNGNGYDTALKALREQFPYYLKEPKYIPVNREAERYSPETDDGYVEPGRLRPTKARDGWHGTNQNAGGGKFSASHSNYQDQTAKYGRTRGRLNPNTFHVSPGRVTPAEAQETEARQAARDAADGKAPEENKVASVLRNSKAVEAANESAAEAAAAVVQDIQSKVKDEQIKSMAASPQYGFMGVTDGAELKARFVQDPLQIRRVQELVESRVKSSDPSQPGNPLKATLDADKIKAFETAVGMTQRKEYDNEKAFVKSGQPFLFSKDGSAYEPGATEDVAEQEARKVAGAYGEPITAPRRSLEHLSNDELGREIDALSRLHDSVRRLEANGVETDKLSLPEKAQVLDDAGVPRTAAVGLALTTAGVQAKAREVQKMRTLNLRRDPGKAETAQLPTRRLEPEDPEAEPNRRRKEFLTHQIATVDSAAGVMRKKAESAIEEHDAAMYKEAEFLLAGAGAAMRGVVRTQVVSPNEYNAVLAAHQDHLVLAQKAKDGKLTDDDVRDFIAKYE